MDRNLFEYALIIVINLHAYEMIFAYIFKLINICTISLTKNKQTSLF